MQKRCKISFDEGLQEFQFGWLIIVLVIPSQILITYFFINNIGDKPFSVAGFIIVSSLLLLACLFFYGLTTKVSADKITVVFGVGVPRKTIAINRIKSVEQVKTPWYYGWGIRYFPGGVLYNISGLDGVELKFKDTENVIRIGSKDSHKLKDEIGKRIDAN